MECWWFGRHGIEVILVLVVVGDGALVAMEMK